MTAIWTYLRKLVGNNAWTTAAIFAFVVILCAFFSRCANADEDNFHAYARAGSSFGTEGYGPVVGLQLVWEHPTYNLFAGTLLWGQTTYNNEVVPNNWDWHGGIESCRWEVCAGIGMTYMQRVDSINGAHTNFMLQLRWKPSTEHFRFTSTDLVHVSDAGTSSVNIGRQALLATWRLQ